MAVGQPYVATMMYTLSLWNTMFFISLRGPARLKLLPTQAGVVLVPGGHGGKARPPPAVLDALAVMELYFVWWGGGEPLSVPSLSLLLKSKTSSNLDPYMNKNAESSMQCIVDKTNELQTYPKQPSEH